MHKPPEIFVIVLAGREQDAARFACQRYPESEFSILSKAEMRESGWRGQLRKMRQLRGKALVIFTDARESLRDPLLMEWTVLMHRCRETVLADSAGWFKVITKRNCLALLPRTLLVALADVFVFALTWIGLQLFRVWMKLARKPELRAAPLDLAYLYPAKTGLNTPGGAHSHITGVLAGLQQEEARTAIFSGQSLPISCEQHQIPGSTRLNLFHEAATLSYNFRFISVARKILRKKRARLLYQRHGRFLFSGAVLSRWLRIPLVLEYNGSEDWIAKHWDPTRFRAWLRLCERVSVSAASLIVVVSSPLKQQLVAAGVSPERILINPNAVDPEKFFLGCGGPHVRERLGFRPDEIVVCFVGTFSYWHGVSVLQKAIQSLLEDGQSETKKLSFLLVGDGPLAPELRNALKPFSAAGRVRFTGAVPHASVREFLDAADILISPHVPMPDGTPFFGSPTKLFEYMAMGKAIAASAMDQIAEVLEHGKTALLVKPGDAAELVQAIRLLASVPRLRSELGHNAREAALARHTWRQTARRVLEQFADRSEGKLESAAHIHVAARETPPQNANLANQNL